MQDNVILLAHIQVLRPFANQKNVASGSLVVCIQ